MSLDDLFKKTTPARAADKLEIYLEIWVGIADDIRFKLGVLVISRITKRSLNVNLKKEKLKKNPI